MEFKQRFIRMCRHKMIENDFDVVCFAVEAFINLSQQKGIVLKRSSFRRGVEEITKDLRRSFKIVNYGSF